jgi:hypothetical protein
MEADELRQRAIAWVERTTSEQGVPLKLTTPELIERVVQILELAHSRRQA